LGKKFNGMKIGEKPVMSCCRWPLGMAAHVGRAWEAWRKLLHNCYPDFHKKRYNYLMTIYDDAYDDDDIHDYWWLLLKMIVDDDFCGRWLLVMMIDDNDYDWW
jgi:hypothetical protein